MLAQRFQLRPQETAATLVRRLAGLPGLCWLDGEAPHAEGRYSFLGAEPVARVEARVGEPDPLARLDRMQMLEQAATSGDLSAPPPQRIPSWVGYVAYDAYHAGKPQRFVRPEGRKVLSFSRYDAWLALDHDRGLAFLVGDDEAACERLRARLARAPQPVYARLGEISVTPRAQHALAIARALEEIAAGNVYQVNLARVFRASFEGDPLALFLALRAQSPVPLGLYYDDGERAVLARTMERFLRWQRSERRLLTRPIKGTIARHGEHDRQDAERLRGDEKEQAELAMIVDLMRNDLGRIAETGSVEVAEHRVVEPYAGLAHLVSTVTCRTPPGLGLRALLEATFPPGSVTGTPKLRAIQLIEALENEPRDVYTGALGFLDRAGGLSLAVAIRTAIVEAGTVRYFAGGGIVEASQLERELDETELKAQVFLQAAFTLGARAVLR
jgi:para-aminobenzoate synthetase component 1